MQLENFKACPPQPLMQPPADFMTHMMENMNKMQLEIQRLNLQNFQQPRK